MVRYGAFVLISIIMMSYILWYMSEMSQQFNGLVLLLKELFHGDVDPTLLDSSVVYDCTAPMHYTLRT